MPNIFIFNPETDYALASFAPSYTPPANVRKVQRQLLFSLLPLAEKGDALYIGNIADEDFGPVDIDHKISQVCTDRRIEILHRGDLQNFLSANGNHVNIIPWGWNPAIRQHLLRHKAPESLLPDHDFLLHYRNLSHRHTSILFNRILNTYLSDCGLSRHCSPIATEFINEEAAMDWIASHHPAFLKAPWSSSGRGIILTSDLSDDSILRWISGIIRKQGSIIAETAAEKVADFATEWWIDSDKNGHPDARFIGMSLFNASGSGNYLSNISLPQAEIMQRIKTIAPDFDQRFIDAQRRALNEIAGQYRGFAGIDMLADKDGGIRACIEINFRITMGIVALFKSNPELSLKNIIAHE